jgi:hypothetical protein
VGEKRLSLDALVKRWAIPTAYGNHNAVGMRPDAGDGLSTQVKRWATPKAQDANSCGAQPNLTEQVKKIVPGALHADWVECLMGLPIGWTFPAGGRLVRGKRKIRGSRRGQSVKGQTRTGAKGSKR